MHYNGYVELTLSGEQFEEIYTTGKLTGFDFFENQYLLAKSEYDQSDVFVFRNGRFERVPYQTLENYYLGKIKPRNPQQTLVIHTLLDPHTKIKLIKGVYGSGKDYLMLAAALQLIEKGKFEKIVFLRPNVGVKGLPDIGALPGTADEKLNWTLAPFWDKVGGEAGIANLISAGQIEPVPMIHLRGRSFENSIIYVTEGQNMTTEITKLVVGRVGEGSELWINADTHQTDKKIFDDDNGVNKMIDRFTGHHLFSYVYMPITERSEVAEMASLLDD